MRKSLIIALAALVASIIVPAALADPTLGDRIIAQEKAKNATAATALEARSEALNQQYGLGNAGDGAAAAALEGRSQALNQQYGLGTAGDVVVQPAAKTAIEQLLAQESGRHGDAALFGPSPTAPVLVAGPSDGFDVRDAGIGGAATLALALLAAAGLAVRSNRRRESTGVATAGN